MYFIFKQTATSQKSQIPKKTMIENQRIIMFLLFSLFLFSRSVHCYKNYTVGDSLGWFDTLEKPNVDYHKWVAGKTFGLGDYLIFNTDNNHSVIQTYNFTIYSRCNFDDALNNDTIQWSASNPSGDSQGVVSQAVPLVKEGMNYFFSSDYDGEQCKNGQNFKINVTHGQGLPESLKSPDEQAPAPNIADTGNDDSAPDTIVPSNFDNPKEVDDNDVKEGSGSVSISMVKSFPRIALVSLILLGLIFHTDVMYVI